MMLLGVAAVVGTSLLVTAFACWVLRVFDHASELRTDELAAILERPATWHDGERIEP